jgi:hypothetical protein
LSVHGCIDTASTKKTLYAVMNTVSKSDLTFAGLKPSDATLINASFSKAFVCIDHKSVLADFKTEVGAVLGISPAPTNLTLGVENCAYGVISH